MKRAFTLFEVVLVLILIGIAAVFSVQIVGPGVRLYLLGQERSALSQQFDNTVLRIGREIVWADPDSLVAPDPTTLNWVSRHPSRMAEGTQTLLFSEAGAGSLVLNGQTLFSPVQSYSVTVEDMPAPFALMQINGFSIRLQPRMDP